MCIPNRLAEAATLMGTVHVFFVLGVIANVVSFVAFPVLQATLPE